MANISTKFGYKPEDEPFHGDVLDRSQIADRLTGYITRFHEGCVIGIDAPWGEGKTWFGRHWEKKLKRDGFTTIWVDTFENDHSEDPFIAIAAQILAALKEDKSATEKLLLKAKDISMAMLPTVGKALVGLAGKAVLGLDVLEEYNEQTKKIVKGAAENLEKRIEKRLKEHDSYRKSVEGFREALAELVGTKKNPVIFFVDELDRCRPDYAVAVVERIKHFFEVPGLVFILLHHRNQLEEAIKGVYGQGVDASQYLGKFINFFMRLPKLQRTDLTDRGSLISYCKILEQRHGFVQDDGGVAFTTDFGHFARILDLSLRDVEKGYILAALAAPLNAKFWIFAWIICLKIKYPKIFYGVLANSSESNMEAWRLATDLAQSFPDYLNLKAIAELHDAAASDSSDGFSDDVKELLKFDFKMAKYHKLIYSCAIRIDFSVSA